MDLPPFTDYARFRVLDNGGSFHVQSNAYYIEDTGIWPYNPEEGGVSKGCEYNVRYLNGVMERFGLADRWAYCFAHERQWFGLSDAKRTEVLETADLLLNISASPITISDRPCS